MRKLVVGFSLITAVDKNGYQEHVITGAEGTGGKKAVTTCLDKYQMFDDKIYKVSQKLN